MECEWVVCGGRVVCFVDYGATTGMYREEVVGGGRCVEERGAQREAQARGAQSAKREAQSAEREARSAKRVRDKYIYIAGRAGFCSGRPASACRRCLTARPPSVARATGRPPRPRQLRERAPSLSHAARAGLLLQFVSRVGSGVRSLQTVSYTHLTLPTIYSV